MASGNIPTVGAAAEHQVELLPQGQRVVLHVGLPKTGTTSIQVFLADNRDELAAKGFFFPILKETESTLVGYHTDLLRALHTRHCNGDSERVIEKWQVAIDSFLDSETLHTFIISHESFSLAHRSIDFRRLSEMFRGLAVEIVVYLRTAEDWITSLYEQGVRSPRERCALLPSEFPGVRRYVKFGFEGILKDLQLCFPMATFHVIGFDSVKKAPGIVPAFLEAINGPQMGRTAAPKNERLTTSQVAVLRALNEKGVDAKLFADVARSMRGANMRFPNNKTERVSILGGDLRADVAARFVEDSAYVKEMYGVSLPRQQDLVAGGDAAMRLTADKIDEVLRDLMAIARFRKSDAANILRSLKEPC